VSGASPAISPCDSLSHTSHHQHVLDGNRLGTLRCHPLAPSAGMNLYFLGRFAVKKIAVGESHTYLVDTLREVRLLEELRHPNIVTYHHSWLETAQFSSFGPKVPTLLYVLKSNP